MTITYTWKVTDLQTNNSDTLQNVVVHTRWTKTGTDENGNSGMFAGATPFKISDVNPKTFKPLNELTESEVLSWIQAVVTGYYEEHVNTKIAEQISKKSIVNQPLPWAAPEPTQEPTPPEST